MCAFKLNVRLEDYWAIDLMLNVSFVVLFGFDVLIMYNLICWLGRICLLFWILVLRFRCY